MNINFMENQKLNVYSEADALKKRLALSYSERFDLLMKLIKANKMMQSSRSLGLKSECME